MGRLEGKTAIVTGGARGIGRASAVKLASEGANVIILDVCKNLEPRTYRFECDFATEADLAKSASLVEAQGVKCVAVVGDARKQEDVDRLVADGIERFGHIDILHANVGTTNYTPFWKIGDEEWNDHIEINLTTAWRSAKAVAPHMIERLRGCIVFTASVNGIEGGVDYAHYIAAKHGVLGLMKSVALELAPYGVRCNAVLPGPTDTRTNDYPAGRARIVGHSGAGREEYLGSIRHWMALRGRTALPPSAIADGVAWLVSEEASNVTGLELIIDAGHNVLPGYNHGPVEEPFTEEQLAGVPDAGV